MGPEAASGGTTAVMRRSRLLVGASVKLALATLKSTLDVEEHPRRATEVRACQGDFRAGHTARRRKPSASESRRWRGIPRQFEIACLIGCNAAFGIVRAFAANHDGVVRFRSRRKAHSTARPAAVVIVAHQGDQSVQPVAEIDRQQRIEGRPARQIERDPTTGLLFTPGAARSTVPRPMFEPEVGAISTRACWLMVVGD